ncbi:MAG: GatB/YqeY domain-containing protein [bacterium]|nr:GatB/YqeY domain-containing protein [bacterium]
MHETIKNQIKEAMRSKDTLRLEVLRGLQALFSNELLAKKSNEPVLKDEDVIAIIKRSVKQRKDSIEQFEKGGRSDLADKERAELKILEEFLPASMGRDEIRKVVESKLESEGHLDKTKMGQFMGTIMKELKGKADGSDVKAVIDEVVKK